MSEPLDAVPDDQETDVASENLAAVMTVGIAAVLGAVLLKLFTGEEPAETPPAPAEPPPAPPVKPEGGANAQPSAN